MKKIKSFEELNESMGSKQLMIFRLYDRSYGPEGNKESLRVTLRSDNTLSYSLYGGWQDSGMGFAISNLQLKRSLPISPKPFKNVKDLENEIRSILSTGVGSNDVKTVEVLNDLVEEKPKRAAAGLIGKNKIIAKLKGLSNLEYCGSSEDMQNALEEIHDLLNEHFPDIEEKLMKNLKTFEKFSQEEIDDILDKMNRKEPISREEEFILKNPNGGKADAKNKFKKEPDYKDTLIEEIMEKVEQYGGYITMMEMEADASPVYKDADQEIHLIERITSSDVEVVVYGGYKYESELDSYDVEYEKLTVETLEEILDLLNDAIENDLLEEDV